jgi:hypothetical protein
LVPACGVHPQERESPAASISRELDDPSIQWFFVEYTSAGNPVAPSLPVDRRLPFDAPSRKQSWMKARQIPCEVVHCHSGPSACGMRPDTVRERPFGRNKDGGAA